MNISKPPITVKQRLYYIALVEKVFADEHTRNVYYKTIPRYRDEADLKIRGFLAYRKKKK